MSPHLAALRPARLFPNGLVLAVLWASACPSTPPCDLPCGDACCDPGASCDPATTTCQVCQPQCDGKNCGDDGCGNTCGNCNDYELCTEQGVCQGTIDAGVRPDVGRPDSGTRPDVGSPDIGQPDAGTRPDIGSPDVGHPPPGPDASAPDVGPKPDAGPTGPPVNFKVMTWNMHDFFDEVDDPSHNDTVETAAWVTSKITKLSTVINKQQPDILAVQEVETEDLLRRLNGSLTAALNNYRLIPANDPRGINVGIMSRFTLKNVISHKDDRLYTPDGRGPYFYSRDCLEVHLDLGGNRELAVLVNHQISQIEDTVDTLFKRQAQALRTRDIADGIRSATPWVAVLIVGDMNEQPSSTGNPTSMDIYFSGNVWADLDLLVTPATNRWTYKVSSKDLELIDYIISDQTTATWAKSVNCIHGSDVTSASDHEPVVGTFTFP